MSRRIDDFTRYLESETSSFNPQSSYLIQNPAGTKIHIFAQTIPCNTFTTLVTMDLMRGRHASHQGNFIPSYTGSGLLNILGSAHYTVTAAGIDVSMDASQAIAMEYRGFTLPNYYLENMYFHTPGITTYNVGIGGFKLKMSSFEFDTPELGSVQFNTTATNVEGAITLNTPSVPSASASTVSMAEAGCDSIAMASGCSSMPSKDVASGCASMMPVTAPEVTGLRTIADLSTGAEAYNWYIGYLSTNRIYCAFPRDDSHSAKEMGTLKIAATGSFSFRISPTGLQITHQAPDQPYEIKSNAKPVNIGTKQFGFFDEAQPGSTNIISGDFSNGMLTLDGNIVTLKVNPTALENGKMSLENCTMSYKTKIAKEDKEYVLRINLGDMVAKEGFAYKDKECKISNFEHDMMLQLTPAKDNFKAYIESKTMNVHLGDVFNLSLTRAMAERMENEDGYNLCGLTLPELDDFNF